MTQHTPGPMIVMYGGQSCSLHLAARSADTNAKNRILQLPRDGKLGNNDPNVHFLRTLAAAPKLLKSLYDIRNAVSVIEKGECVLTKTENMKRIALAAITEATGA